MNDFNRIDTLPPPLPKPAQPPVIPSTKQLEGVVALLLKQLDPTPDREGLAETPARVAKAWAFWTQGYRDDPAKILKTFDAEDYSGEAVMVGPIPLYSKCEHHLADIQGHAWVAYIPDGKVVGLSKLVRLVNCYARRLQVQERMTTQIASALMEHLKPRGAAVRIVARHMCMESRGVCAQGQTTETVRMYGDFNVPHRREEFLHASRASR